MKHTNLKLERQEAETSDFLYYYFFLVFYVFSLFTLQAMTSKRILTYLKCIKKNEINRGHADDQKHISHTVSHKRFLVYYRLCSEMTGKVFLFVFHGLIVLH